MNKYRIIFTLKPWGEEIIWERFSKNGATARQGARKAIKAEFDCEPFSLSSFFIEPFAPKREDIQFPARKIEPQPLPKKERPQ